MKAYLYTADPSVSYKVTYLRLTVWSMCTIVDHRECGCTLAIIMMHILISAATALEY